MQEPASERERDLHNIELIKGLFDYFTSLIELTIDRQRREIARGGTKGRQVKVEAKESH